jgi:hypothetical protein
MRRIGIPRTVSAVLAALAAGSAAACSGGTGPAPGPGAPTATAPGPSGSGPAGVGAADARTRGVLSTRFDAALRGPDRAPGGRVTLRLLNVGQQPDAYRISVRPAGAARLSPATAELAPGEGAPVTATLTADVSVRVFSVGRGAEVADLPVTLG